VNKHLYLCHPLVLSSPTLMMHDDKYLKFGSQIFVVCLMGVWQRNFEPVVCVCVCVCVGYDGLGTSRI